MLYRLLAALVVALAGLAALLRGADLVHRTLHAANESILGWTLLAAGVLLLLGSFGLAGAE